METIFELEVENGWYIVSGGGIEDIICSLQVLPALSFDNIREVNGSSEKNEE